MGTKGLLALLKEASPLDLFLISFLLLPFVFEAWLDVLAKLELGKTLIFLALAVVLIAYIIGVVALITSTSRIKRREVALDQIINYLNVHEYIMISFERVRDNISTGYSDSFLESVIATFPDQVRKAQLKGSKRGIAKLIESTVEDEGRHNIDDISETLRTSTS